MPSPSTSLASNAKLNISRNQWTFDEDFMIGQEIEDSTVGIVGLGGIGQAIVKRLKAFLVARFLYCGNKEKEEGMHCIVTFIHTLAFQRNIVLGFLNTFRILLSVVNAVLFFFYSSNTIDVTHYINNFVYF